MKASELRRWFFAARAAGTLPKVPFKPARWMTVTDEKFYDVLDAELKDGADCPRQLSALEDVMRIKRFCEGK